VNIKRIKNLVIIHPFLFALSLPLHFYTHNLGALRGGEVWFALLCMAGWVFMSWFILALVFRNVEKAALATSFYTVLIWAYDFFLDIITSGATSKWSATTM
jgi:hypothetical protein